MFTTVAFYESQDAAAALVKTAALTDQHIYTSGDDLRIPELNALVALAAGVGSGGAGYARLDAPSLLDVARVYVQPVNGNADADAEPGSPPAVMDLRANPLQLTTDEAANFYIDSNTTAAAAQWGILWLADGPIQPIAAGEIIPVRATATGTLTADAWTLVTPTFADTLPVGDYAIVGLRAQAAGLVAARCVFKGGPWRPGVLGCDSDSDLDAPMFRAGGMGVFGEFHSTTPPDIECLSISADTAEEFVFDLVKIG